MKSEYLRNYLEDIVNNIICNNIILFLIKQTQDLMEVTRRAWIDSYIYSDSFWTLIISAELMEEPLLYRITDELA